MVDPAVSVILATNRAGSAPYLSKAIATVLAQREASFELIIVDDGSPDETTAAGIALGDARVLHVRLNGVGVARARNIGVSLTRGPLLAFIDDDDAWDPERLSHHVAVMEADSEIAVSYCRMRSIDAADNEIAPGDQTPVHDIHDVYRHSTGILLGNMVIRRDAFVEVGGFDPVFRIAEDLDFLLRVARLGRVAFVDGPVLVDYRAHESNTTRQHRKTAEGVRAVVRLHRWAALQRGDADLAADLKRSLAANGRYAAWSATRAAKREMSSGHPLDAAAELFWALRFAPGAPISWLSRRLRAVKQGMPT
ncbi:glycosyltransferase family 2 protein [Rathayibacter sp. CAU 1779]